MTTGAAALTLVGLTAFASTTSAQRRPATPTTTTGISACAPAPIHHGAPPTWTAAAWSSSSPGLKIPYALASGGTAAAFFFAPSLRTGHPSNPANKILWVVGSPRNGRPLHIAARWSARPSVIVRSQWPANASPGEIYPSYVDLPKPGCWALTLSWNGHSATIDLQVH